MTKIPPLAARKLRRDIESAAERKSVVELRSFGREAELSDMPEEAARAHELAGLIESWQAKANREELMQLLQVVRLRFRRRDRRHTPRYRRPGARVTRPLRDRDRRTAARQHRARPSLGRR